MGPFCQVDAPPPGPVAGSKDEVLLTAPEIDCSSQITVTEELSFAFFAPKLLLVISERSNHPYRKF